MILVPLCNSPGVFGRWVGDGGGTEEVSVNLFGKLFIDSFHLIVLPKGFTNMRVRVSVTYLLQLTEQTNGKT